jgi:hypothetical protein
MPRRLQETPPASRGRIRHNGLGTHRYPFPKDGNIYNQPMDSEMGIKHQQDQYKEDVRHLREENVSPESEPTRYRKRRPRERRQSCYGRRSVICLPSSEITTSTRRLSWRPATVSLVATGNSFP